jgi:hypothetical protein
VACLVCMAKKRIWRVMKRGICAVMIVYLFPPFTVWSVFGYVYTASSLFII